MQEGFKEEAWIPMSASLILESWKPDWGSGVQLPNFECQLYLLTSFVTLDTFLNFSVSVSSTINWG